jgi:hypothetical protein
MLSVNAMGEREDAECAAPGEVGEMWTIPHFNHSGLYSVVYSDPHKTQVVHYVRQETKCLWNKLEECRTSEFEQFALLHVCGDTASGKSSTVWGYAQFVGNTSPVVWVTQDILGYQLAWCAPQTAPTHERFKFNDYRAMLTAVIRLEPTLVVLDSIVMDNAMVKCYLPAMLETFLMAMNHRCMFVFCSHLQCADYFGSYLNNVAYSRWFMCGWTVADMFAAREAAIRTGVPVFPANLLDKTDDSAFRRQLHLAGGNIRFMKYDASLVEDILRHFFPPRNWDDLWWSFILRRDTFNLLFVHNNHGKAKRFVSDFVYKEVARRVSLYELDHAEASINTENNALMGMFFELRVRKILSNAAATGQCITFTKTSLLSLSATFRITKVLDEGDPESGGPAHLECTTVCHIPIKCCAGSFDFALIRRDKRGKYDVYFLQLTVAHSEDALLQYAAMFLHRMFPNNASAPVHTCAQKRDGTAVAAEKGPSTEGPANLQLYGVDCPVPVVPTQAFPAMKIHVHYYFVLPRGHVRDFKLAACNIEDAASMQKFDPAFRKEKIRVAYVSSHKT